MPLMGPSGQLLFMQGINQRRLRSFGRRTQHPENATPRDQERRPDEDNVGEPMWETRDGRRHQPVGTSVETVRDCSGGWWRVEVVATLLHPSRETAMTIVATESRLVAAHVAYTLA